MVTDRTIIISNQKRTLDITAPPFYVDSTEGFDTLDIQTVSSQGYDQDGATVLNTYVLPRSMEINGEIKADTTEGMQRVKNRLIDIFLPKTELTINHYYGGENRLITAIVEKTPKFSFTKVSQILEYKVSMVAAEPYWRDAEESMIQIANYRGGLRFPLSIPRNSGVTFGIKSPSLIANIPNKSTIKVGMRFTFIARGEVTNPQLFNIKTRQFFKLNCSMEAGEEITVETGQNKTVTRRKNGIESNYIGRIDLAGGGNRFMELEPGDNLFRYAAEGGEDMLEIKILYSNRYAGV